MGSPTASVFIASPETRSHLKVQFVSSAAHRVVGARRRSASGAASRNMSAISTRTDTTSPPAIVFVQPVSQSVVPAGRSRSIVIPPRMFGQAPGRGSHLLVSDPRPARSAIGRAPWGSWRDRCETCLVYPGTRARVTPISWIPVTSVTGHHEPATKTRRPANQLPRRSRFFFSKSLSRQIARKRIVQAVYLSLIHI